MADSAPGGHARRLCHIRSVRRVLIVNPVASGVTKRRVDDVMDALATGGGIELIVTERAGQATEIVDKACDDCGAIFIFAGDGGYNEAVNGMRAGADRVPSGRRFERPATSARPTERLRGRRAAARRRRADPAHLDSGGFATPVGPRPVAGSRSLPASGWTPSSCERSTDAGGETGSDPATSPSSGSSPASWPRGADSSSRCSRSTAVGAVPWSWPPTATRTPMPAPSGACRAARALRARARRRRARAARPKRIPWLAWRLLVRPTHPGASGVVYVHDADRLAIRCDHPLPLQVDGEDLGDVAEVVLERSGMR